MKSIFINLSLLFFVSFSQAQNRCDLAIQGGVDTWPWSVAQPFPWTTIQGIWKLNSDSSNTYFRMRVTNSSSIRKFLKIEKISNGNCRSPIANGVGYISSDEKNVVRMIMSDRTLRYQLKLAMFDAKDLTDSSGSSYCSDQQVLAASVQVIGPMGHHSARPIISDQYGTENMLLKKISGSLDSICKKSAAH